MDSKLGKVLTYHGITNLRYPKNSEDLYLQFC